MQRMTDALSRMLNDPSTRNAMRNLQAYRSVAQLDRDRGSEYTLFLVVAICCCYLCTKYSLANSRERRVTEDGSEADGHDQDNNAVPPDAEGHRTEEGGEGQVDVVDGNREGSAQSAPEEESSQSNEVYCELLIQN